jgi:predicted lipopolysaccharide heptosyltransferase III
MRSLQILPELPQGAKILFIRLRSLGDTLLATPLYACLKAWRPDLQLAVLVEEPNQEVLEGNPDLHDLLTIPSRSPGNSTLSQRIAMLRRIRSLGFDCSIDLHGGSTSALFTLLGGAKYRIGLKSLRHRYAYNVGLTAPARDRSKHHTVEHQMEWLRQLGLPAGEIPPLKLVVTPEDKLRAQERLAAAGVDPCHSYVVIQPASRFSTKEWTDEGFAEIADYLVAEWGWKVVMTGSRLEGEKLRRIAARASYPPVIFGDLSVCELKAVLAGARLFIGNDSGPTHMAAALSIPVVVLFGSSDSRVWYPWKTRYCLVQNPFDCNPCPGYQCLVYEEPRCILSITPEQVKAAIDSILT